MPRRSGRDGAARRRPARRPSSPRPPARARMPTQGSWRPLVRISISSPAALTRPARRQDRRGRLDREARRRSAGRSRCRPGCRRHGCERKAAARRCPCASRRRSPRRVSAAAREAGADLDALDRVDAHQRRGEIGVELAVDRRAPAGRHARWPRPRSPRRRRSRPCATSSR